MRHLFNVARSLLHHHRVPKIFWGEIVLIATYLINRVPTKLLQHQNPFQCLSAHFPNLFRHASLPLRVFGYVSFVHIPKHHRDKFDPRALRCAFIGYSPTQKGYKCYHPSTRKVYVSKDVTFMELASFFDSQAGH